MVIISTVRTIELSLPSSLNPNFCFGARSQVLKHVRSMAGPATSLPTHPRQQEWINSNIESRCIWTLDARDDAAWTSRTGASTYRSDGMSTYRSDGTPRHRSKVNRAGGQGIDHTELMRVRAIVEQRRAVEDDELWLQEQQKMLRPGPFHVMSGTDNSSDDDDDEAARRRRRRRKKRQAELEKKAAALTAEADEEPESPPATFRDGVEEVLLEHGFSIGGQHDSRTLSSDASDRLELNAPSCITVLPDGELCIADTQEHRLVIVTPEGAPRAYLHGGEGKQEALRLPRGVVCDDTALYVSEVGGSRVRKLRLPEEFRLAGAATPRGSHLGGLALDAESAVDGQLTFPQGLALDRGELFVADCEEHRIAVYDALTLCYRRSFGSVGEGPGELSYPYSCVVVNGEVIVADVGNHRLMVFSREGAYRRTIGKQGTGPVEFNQPRSVAVLHARQPLSPPVTTLPAVQKQPDLQAAGENGGEAAPAQTGSVPDEPAAAEEGAKDDGTLLVVGEKERVQVMTLEGEGLQIVQIEGALDLWGIAIAGRHVYVTDRESHCIHVLTPPRRRATAESAWARYASYSPNRGARVAAYGAVSAAMAEAEQMDALCKDDRLSAPVGSSRQPAPRQSAAPDALNTWSVPAAFSATLLAA